MPAATPDEVNGVSAMDTTTDSTDTQQQGATGDQQSDSEKGKEQATGTFSQADVDRIVADRLKREREATKAKYADYDDLKKAAEGAKTAEDRIADLEKQVASTQHEAMKRRVQAAHGVTDEDADLFLTGADEETLTAQAQRLASRDSERKKTGNRSPREGSTNTPAPDKKREWLRSLRQE